MIYNKILMVCKKKGSVHLKSARCWKYDAESRCARKFIPHKYFILKSILILTKHKRTRILIQMIYLYLKRNEINFKLKHPN